MHPLATMRGMPRGGGPAPLATKGGDPPLIPQDVGSFPPLPQGGGPPPAARWGTPPSCHKEEESLLPQGGGLPPPLVTRRWTHPPLPQGGATPPLWQGGGEHDGVDPPPFAARGGTLHPCQTGATPKKNVSGSERMSCERFERPFCLHYRYRFCCFHSITILYVIVIMIVIEACGPIVPISFRFWYPTLRMNSIFRSLL